MTKKQLREKLLEAARTGVRVWAGTMEGAHARGEFRQADNLFRCEDSDGKIIYFEVLVKEVQ